MNPLHRVLSILAPDDCLVCGAEGLLLCPACQEAELLPAPSCCFRCGKLTHHYATCRSCRSQTKLAAVSVASQYRATARELVHTTKFTPRRGGVEVMADLMLPLVKDVDPDLLTHCPTSHDRIRSRGFDQSALLAKMLAMRLRKPYAAVFLRKTVYHQVGASRAERIRYAEAAYRVKSPQLVAGKHVLLIDDVYTTGATITATARLLKEAGVQRVTAAVFAH